MLIQKGEIDLKSFEGLYVVRLTDRPLKNKVIPLVNRLVKFIELFRLEGLGRVLPGSDW